MLNQAQVQKRQRIAYSTFKEAVDKLVEVGIKTSKADDEDGHFEERMIEIMLLNSQVDILYGVYFAFSSVLGVKAKTKEDLLDNIPEVKTLLRNMGMPNN